MILALFIGCILITYGIISVTTGKSIFWKKRMENYTEDSVLLYTQLSGILHIVIGGTFLLLFFGNSIIFSLFIKWICLSVLWLAVAAHVAVYLITPVKK